MRFWLGLYGMQSPRTHPRSLPWLYEETIRHAVEAERLGFDGFALTEHHFWYDGYCPALLPVLAAIARRTEMIRLLPFALLLPLRDPLRVAEEIAVVDHLSRGRLTLGLGYGYRAEEFQGFGLEKSRVPARYFEIVEILRRAFGDGPLSFAGEYYSYEDVEIHPKPFQPGGPPLCLAGGSREATARRAGRLGMDYCIAGTMLPVSSVQALIDTYRTAADQANVPPGQIVVAIDVAIADTQDEVERIVAEDLRPVFAEQLAAFGFLRDAEGRSLTEVGPDHPVWTPLLNSFVLGSPDEVIARIESFRDLGCDVFLARIMEANLRSDRILREARLFAERVIPHFREGAGR
ncbi:MAG: LLM class flavin-dependent oxidoreductase [Gammaproteobacteria bacterium]|nr:LLM class flavin-dependent oxidoreductase [Gammaproteobacteria bacterium]